VLEVVVLAAGTHAALGGDRAVVRPLLEAEEDVLELHHARVGEEERGIVARDERARGDGLVALRREVVDELLANLFGIHGLAVTPVRPGRAPRQTVRIPKG